MNTKNPIIEKIKKLLRMKRGGTPDEIATALRLAQELAEKHGIDLNAVNPDEENHERPIQHEDEILGCRVSWESKYAVLVCKQFFKVEVFQTVNEAATKYVWRFVGEEWDIQIAIYVYRFLCGHFRREWNTKRGRCRNRQAFLWGMYQGLCNKLWERQPKEVQEPGLIKIERALERRKQYIQQHWGDLLSSSVEPDDDAAMARWKGFQAGRATEIRSGVEGGSASQTEELPTGSIKLLS
jgi:hypothetical protein